MKNIILSMLAILTIFAGSIDATIIKTTEIKDINKEITSDSLVLFNIAEVLMDTHVSLGTQAWRKYVRTRVDAKTHDELTLFVFRNIPPKAPEDLTPIMIADMQSRGIPVLAFTSRGRHEWYTTQVPQVDLITEDLLRKINIDFARTTLPSQLSGIDTIFGDYYHDGIIYTTNALDKGELLGQLLEETGYRPSKIVFIDDKADSLKSVEVAMQKYGIEFVGFAYTRTAKDHANFDPMIANIQLDWLITHGKVLSDEQAAQIKVDQFADVNPDTYFAEIVQKWKDLQDSVLGRE